MVGFLDELVEGADHDVLAALLGDKLLEESLVLGLRVSAYLELVADEVVCPGGDEEDEVGDSGPHAHRLEACGLLEISLAAVRDVEQQVADCRVRKVEPLDALPLKGVFDVSHGLLNW